MPNNRGHWEGIPPDPYNCFGFVYLIKDETSGRMYVGKKQYFKSKSIKGCKGKITDRRSKKWKTKCWSDSDWRIYKGSSRSLHKWMSENPDNLYSYTIIKQCRSRGDLHYSELKELWDRDVLKTKDDEGEYLYFNRSIGAIKFRPPEFLEEEII